MINYLVSLIIVTAIYALFSLGLNLQWGLTGLINFGHVASMTLGAYTTVLLSARAVPLPVAVLCGALLAALLGVLIGFFTLRLREDYLSIVTIGVSEVIRLVALNEEWLTRGAFGVQNFPLPLAQFRPTLFSRLVMIGIFTLIAIWAMGQVVRWLQQRYQKLNGAIDGTLILVALLGLGGLWVYWIAATSLYRFNDNPARNGLMLISVILTAITFWMLERLAYSPWGRVLKAIREDEEVAKALGKDVFWYKQQSLMLGNAIAAIAGSLLAWQLTSVYPSTFEPLTTFYAWIIVVLGGAGNNAGTILGAVILWAYFEITRFLPNLIQALHGAMPFIPPTIDPAREGAVRLMFIGLLLMLLMMLRPQGILGKKEELTLGR